MEHSHYIYMRGDDVVQICIWLHSIKFTDCDEKTSCCQNLRYIEILWISVAGT